MQYNLKRKQYPSGEEQITTYSLPIRYDLTRKARSCSKNEYANIKEAQYRAKQSEKSSLARTRNKIYDLARSNATSFTYFLTITFSPQKVDSFSYSKVSVKLSRFLSNFKRRCPSLRYIGVPEKHKSGRFHFHFLVSKEIEKWLVDSNVKTKEGDTVYNFSAFHLGYTTVTQIRDPFKTTRYITKYITKSLIDSTPGKGKKRYWHSSNLVVPQEQKLLLEKKTLDKYNDLLKKKADYHKLIQYEFSNDIQENIQEINIYEINHHNNAEK